MNAHRLALNLDLHPPRSRHVDPDAAADADLRKARERNASPSETAMRLAAAGAVCAQDVATAAAIPLNQAHTVLSNLRQDGRLERVARGHYTLPGAFGRQQSSRGGGIGLAQGERKAEAKRLSEAEAFCARKDPLPPARVPDLEAPLLRRRRA